MAFWVTISKCINGVILKNAGEYAKKCTVVRHRKGWETFMQRTKLSSKIGHALL